MGIFDDFMSVFGTSGSGGGAPPPNPKTWLQNNDEEERLRRSNQIKSDPNSAFGGADPRGRLATMVTGGLGITTPASTTRQLLMGL